ncbi:Asp-tRNA(Asn)/Glu-tRNA(Gln) amidotransferase subunit GatC [Candidatus Berkelbacteria bacterium]|nr:Asp-tRNA(Asn)/Glu-tRNA(Gln) amidotransferase subunit GatC [Candidatus Berkelbacteria bacterium]
MAKKKIINKELVAHLAVLSRLELTPDKLALFEHQLGEILEYVATINEIKTGTVALTQTTTGLTNVFRADTPEDRRCLPLEEVLKNASSHQDGYFKVKALFE